MYLHPIEAQSALWLKLKELMLERLDTLRHQNDGVLSLEETARLRGRIAELKNLLALEAEGSATEQASSGPTHFAGLDV